MYKQFYSKLLLLVAMIVAGAGTVSAADKWVKTAPANLQTGDIVVIVDQNSGRAMSNNGGTSSAPTATSVELNSDMSELSGTIASTLQWEVTVTTGTTRSYQFGVTSGTETKYLYCTNTNNGVRVGDNDNNVFTIHDNDGTDFLLNSGTSRYVGVYSSGNTNDWRCYTSINANIKYCVTAFYKKVTDQSGLTPIGTIGDLTPTTVNIETEGTFELPITFASNDPTDYEVTWESNNTDVLDVDNDGNYQAYTAGEVTITVNIEPVDDQTYEAVSKEFTVTVIDPADIITYEKVTNANQLVAGNEYILVAENSNVAMGAQNNKLRTPVDVTISNNKVAIHDEAVAVLTLGGVSGAWTFQASDNDKYLALTANSNEVHASDDATLATSKWTITDDFQLEMTAQTDARYLRYNSGSPRFACYKSGQVEAYLYVKQGSATNTKAAAEISFEETSYEVNLGESFTAPELTNPNQLEVTYASSNTDVATVNETSGEVTIVAAGQTTITATFAGNDEYEAGTASYTLTVVDPNAPGTANNPYTVEAAIAYINTLGTSSSPTEVYVKGIVSQVDSYNETYKSITYWISDDGETTTQMEVYSGKGLNSADFASIDDIQVGDEVTVCGTVKLYKQTPEFDYNNYLVSFNRPVVPEVKYYLAGSWDGETSWGADGMIEMTKNDDGTYSVSKEFTAEYTEFKIYKKDVDESETWYGGATNDEKPYRIYRDWYTAPLSGENTAKNFIINEAGNYTFTVDVDALTLTVTGFPAQEFFLAGSFNEWSTTANQFEIGTTENVYTLTQELEAGVQFKVVSEGNWYGYNGTIDAENCTSIALSTDGGNMTIATAGTYTFTLTKTQNGLFLTIDGFPEPVVKYYLAGSWENGNGWTADGMVELNEQDDGSFINTINNFEANTEFKIVKDVNGAKTWFGGLPLVEGSEYYLVNKDWCTDIVLKNDTEVDGGYKNFKIEKAGDYTFKVTDEGKDGLFLDVAGWVVNYALVTDASQLEEGKDIIIVGENNGTLYAMAAQKENNRAAEVVTKEKGIIAVNHSGSIPFITLDSTEGEAGTLWGFDTDDGYLCSASSDKNYLHLLTSSLMSFTDHPEAQATIEIAEDGQATIVFQKYDRNNLRFNYNNGSPLFSCYAENSSVQNLPYIYMETELDEIPLEVTITDAKWATYVAEDDVTFPEGVTAYVPTTISTTSVGLTQVTQAMKGEAVIVNGAADTYQLAYAEQAISEKNADNQFEISDGTVSDGTQYVLSNKKQGIVGFYKVKSGVTIPTGKPYLVITNDAKDFVPFGGGEATGIETIDNGQLTIGDAYDLQGRKVQKLTKGIFIQNGRKIVVK